MEPADIDWKNIESHFTRDETYEYISAPMWLDLSAPDSPSSAADEAWFCRPDCRHPKTAADFLRLSPSPKSLKPVRPSPQRMPLGERKSSGLRDGNSNASANAINNRLKRRGAIASLLLSSSSPTREPMKNSKGNGKKFRDDLENRDPNLLVGNSTGTATNTNKRPVKTLKEMIKSSAEKKGVVMNQEEGEEMRSKKPAPRLRSTLSARNLFSGRDILGQILEFCHEIKKLAVGKEKSSAAAKEADEEERKASLDANSNGDGDGSVKTEIEGKNCKKNRDEKSSVLKEVRACPPTPQRFPSPSSRSLRSTKPATSAGSPLNKPLKPVAAPERGILQELDQGRGEKRTAAMAVKDEDCNRVSAAVAGESEGTSMDMFWFLKPCTYLVK